MLLKKGQWPIFIVNLVYLIIALFVFLGRANYEFVLYVGVIVFFFVVILLTNNRVNYPNSVLWGLTVWGIMHMLGGGLLLGESEMRLYEWMIVTIAPEYNFFRYDQLVHAVGFAVATLVMYVVLKPNLKEKVGWWSLGIVLAMAGLGVGALNEIVEFIAVVLVPETGVGGFINVAMDLVADLVGAILAVLWIRAKNGRI